MKLAIAGAIAVVGGYLFFWWRLVRPFEPTSWQRRAWTSLLILLFSLVVWFPLTWFLPVGLEGTRFEPFRHWATFTAMGALVILGLVVLARDLLLMMRHVSLRLAVRGEGGVEGRVVDEGRRRFVQQSTSIGALMATGTLGAGAFAGARKLVVEEVEVSISRLAPSLEGLRIVQVSDLHVGHTVGRCFVEAVVRTVNSLDADVVVITGDLSDGTVDMLGAAVAPLEGLRASEGVFYVTGNHEYYWGDAAGWVREVERLGGRPLVNEHVILERDGAALVLAGVTDYRAGDYLSEHRSDPARAFDGAPAGAPRVLLAHQPRSVEQLSGLDVDLQLSGHTHGGQIFPFHCVALLSQPVLSGLHRFGRTWLYVNRGTGYWGPPFRLFSAAEVSLLTMVSAE